MEEIIFDDIGSYPLPDGVSKEWVQNAFKTREEDEKLFTVINDAFQQKIDAGVQVPTYPQYQDMNEQFLKVIRDESCCDGPFEVKLECARIEELDAIESVAKVYKEKFGETLQVRICVTGPAELYLKEFGGRNYADIYSIFAKNVNKFVRNSMKSAKNFKIATVSIDEPSIGLNPELAFDNDQIISALTDCSKAASKWGADVEIHLHSALYYNLACETPTINVIGMESAGTPSYMDLIDKKVLEDTDSFLRVGIARTDIYTLAGALNEKYNTNVWKEQEYLPEIVTELETPQVITKRLRIAYRRFGNLIKYVGPDCGLGSWPNQKISFMLLSNVAQGIKDFRECL
ncbi:5-methyltetrahydropteroyltriglutamate-- homocysteine methyltransferase [Methanosarcina sp. MTP4]|uniref:methionine synthase n=1 Tax=Methanosarcina sp. MTP4 TaxID=1434100 RepID=UPI0006154A48|nr:methionine synthase [Methanosarcina sp. MTP4]AKB26673.1 5-methyltetrahydropteroyltriglutamate-- homocysteine methyltransferase [Methanosarcina sp. MTP4]